MMMPLSDVNVIAAATGAPPEPALLKPPAAPAVFAPPLPAPPALSEPPVPPAPAPPAPAIEPPAPAALAPAVPGLPPALEPPAAGLTGSELLQPATIDRTASTLGATRYEDRRFMVPTKAVKLKAL